MRYEGWSAMNQLEPERWKCEYCHAKGEGKSPFKSKYGFDACCSSHVASLDYLDEIEDQYRESWRDTIVAVGLLLMLLAIAILGDLQ